MIKAELRSLFARKLRTILTMIAIILGVSMISGTYVLTDTISSSFNQIFQQATRHIDAVVTGKALIPSESQPNPPLPASLLPVVQKTPGTLAADGEIADRVSLYSLSKKATTGQITRTSIGSAGGAPSLLFGVGDSRFNQLTLVSGQWPSGYQVALDESTMSRSKLHLGEVIAVVTVNHPLHLFTIVGTTRFGNVGSIGGATLVDMDLATAQLMTGKVAQFDQISAMAIPGISQKRLTARIRAWIPPALRNHVRVRTGEAQANNQASQIGQALNILTIALLAFGGIAVFVGAFIIFNTFSITVAQRAREFALFRTLGSSRAQILRSVIAEALLIGATSSAIGLVAGLGIAKGLNQLLKAIGADLPNSGFVIESRTVEVALIVGTVVTTMSALMPAVRATRVPPIAAMREGATLPKGELSQYMPYISSAITVVGLLITAFGTFASISSTGGRLAVIGFGCVVLFIGVAMFSPQLVPPVASAVGWPIERLTNVTGRLARENAVRNPSRTANTAAALMIGLALIGFVTIFAAEVKKSADDTINRDVAGTFIIENSLSNQSSIQPGASTQIAAVPGVSVVSPIKDDVARIHGLGKHQVDAVDPRTFGRVYRLQWKTGNDATLTSLGPHDALIDDGFQSSHHLHIGSRFQLVTTAGITDSFVVAGVYKSSPIIASVTIPIATFTHDWQEQDSLLLVINAKPGVNLTALENRIDNVVNLNYPYLSVSSQAQFKAQQDMQINIVLALFYVLLGLSILVSLFGIVNTLVLSIYERTREIGMLRAIGTTRRQVRWMIRWESVITSLIGAILGLALGIVLAVLITLGLQGQGIEFALPVFQLLIWLVVAIFFGIGAAAFPARRAARLDVLRAVSYE